MNTARSAGESASSSTRSAIDSESASAACPSSPGQDSERVLDDVLGVAHRPGHPVGDGEQQRPVPRLRRGGLIWHELSFRVMPSPSRQGTTGSCDTVRPAFRTARACSARYVEAVAWLPDRGGAASPAVLFEVALVVLLGPVERRGGGDLRDDLPPHRLLLGVARCDRGFLLPGVVIEDRRAVLAADVETLPVAGGRIVQPPERLEQLGVTDLGGVEPHLDRFGVAGAAS